ncbi:MAG: hypothetical protein PHQ75_15370 [Thermoguttaceae bacterium]|nr:hypothetical protein [Thermoguttaceae bacterium]
MSSTDFHRLPEGSGDMVANGILGPQVGTDREPRLLNRIGEIRRNQCLSLSYCAKRLGLSTQEARAQEDPAADLTITQVLAWQEVLDVPLSEMIEQENVLEDPIRNRAMLLKVMKTAKQIQKTTREARVKNMTTTLVDQLVEIMPELVDVSSWPDIGQSHENRDYGQAAYRRFEPGISRAFDNDF